MGAATSKTARSAHRDPKASPPAVPWKGRVLLQCVPSCQNINVFFRARLGCRVFPSTPPHSTMKVWIGRALWGSGFSPSPLARLPALPQFPHLPPPSRSGQRRDSGPSFCSTGQVLGTLLFLKLQVFGDSDDCKETCWAAATARNGLNTSAGLICLQQPGH
jgi:hypothetical protein